MDVRKKLTRRSFLGRVAGGATLGAGALGALGGCATLGPTDSDSGPYDDPVG